MANSWRHIRGHFVIKYLFAELVVLPACAFGLAFGVDIFVLFGVVALTSVGTSIAHKVYE